MHSCGYWPTRLIQTILIARILSQQRRNALICWRVAGANVSCWISAHRIISLIWVWAQLQDAFQVHFIQEGLVQIYTWYSTLFLSLPLLSCTECAWLMQNLLKTLLRVKWCSCSRLFPSSLYFLYPLHFHLYYTHPPPFLLNEVMFIWICLYFSIRWWPSLLHIISWLCPWCQVTQWVTAEQLPAVASEKACDWHLLSGMKKEWAHTEGDSAMLLCCLLQNRQAHFYQSYSPLL